MYNNKKILGIITARGGSKSIPRKNIKPLSGRPLIEYTILATQASKYLTSCIVSTEDKEIAQIAKNCGGDVPFLRPQQLAQDNSTSLSVVQDVIAKFEVNNEEYDYIMILQPTSPFRTGDDIDNCIKLIIDEEGDSVMSMSELVGISLTKLKKIENGEIVGLVKNEGGESTRRQELEKIYVRNGGVYLTRTQCIKKGDLFGKKSLAYIMPPEKSIDINEPFDFEVAGLIMSKK